MKVKDLIKKLQEFDPELIVCLADWQEEYSDPSEEAAEEVSLVEGDVYWPTIGDEKDAKTFVCIG